jgi:hypothetical protein
MLRKQSLLPLLKHSAVFAVGWGCSYDPTTFIGSWYDYLSNLRLPQEISESMRLWYFLFSAPVPIGAIPVMYVGTTSGLHNPSIELHLLKPHFQFFGYTFMPIYRL